MLWKKIKFKLIIVSCRVRITAVHVRRWSTIIAHDPKICTKVHCKGYEGVGLPAVLVELDDDNEEKVGYLFDCLPSSRGRREGTMDPVQKVFFVYGTPTRNQ